MNTGRYQKVNSTPAINSFFTVHFPPRRARSFQTTYFPEGPAGRPETDGMRALRRLGEGLGAPGGPAALFGALQGEGTVSTFEFLASGTVGKLRVHLMGAGFIPLTHRVNPSVL